MHQIIYIILVPWIDENIFFIKASVLMRCLSYKEVNLYICIIKYNSLMDKTHFTWNLLWSYLLKIIIYLIWIQGFEYELKNHINILIFIVI